MLTVRLTGFVSFLRENGFTVGVDDAALLVDMATHIGILDRQVLRWSAQSLLCRRAADQQRFGELFDAWFLPPNRRNYAESHGCGSGALEHGGSRVGGDDSSEGSPITTADRAGATGPEPGSTTQRGASEAETLAQADFRHLHQPH